MAIASPTRDEGDLDLDFTRPCEAEPETEGVGLGLSQLDPPDTIEVALSALDELPVPVLVTDETRAIVHANRFSEALFRRTRRELLGSPLETLVIGATLDPPARLGTTMQREEANCEILLPDGEHLCANLTARPLTFGSNTLYRVLCVRDVSAIKRLEEERNRLLRIATIGEALPSLLHELKNPLAAISAATEVLLEETDTNDVREQLHAILSEIRRMKLSFDGIGALERPLRADRPQAVDFACREAGTVLVHRAKNAGQNLRLRISDMPLLPLDPGVIRALVLNFVTNALHAGSAGDTITLNAWYEEPRRTFELRVVDTGRGMSPETLARTTELFFSTKKSGSGIGLALCKRVVEGAGGSLLIESVLGFGTAVEVSVPVA